MEELRGHGLPAREERIDAEHRYASTLNDFRPRYGNGIECGNG
jgi:hypothetical protein